MANQNAYITRQPRESMRQGRKEIRSSSSSIPPGSARGEREEEPPNSERALSEGDLKYPWEAFLIKRRINQVIKSPGLESRDEGHDFNVQVTTGRGGDHGSPWISGRVGPERGPTLLAHNLSYRDWGKTFLALT